MNRPLAMEKLAEFFHNGSVLSDPNALRAFVPDNPLIADGRLPAAVIRPKNTGELAKLLQIANKHGLNICPVSSTGGHYQGGFTTAEEHLLVDLSTWQGIQWINRRNRVCLIQPGVTYGQLLKALEPEGLTVSIPLAPPDGKSVLAACMDREPTTWPNKQWDIGDPVASTEFYFGTGERFRTGAAGGPGSLEEQRTAGGAQKCPTGPSQTDFHRVLQGAQGTMGIVTWTTMRAERKPVRQEPFLIGDQHLEKLIDFVYDIQRPWLGEHTFIVNRFCASMLISATSNEDFQTVYKQLPEYICLQNIAGFDLLPKQRIAYQKKDIQEKARRYDLEMKKTLGSLSATHFLQTATRPCGPVDWRLKHKGDCLSVFFLTTLNRAPGLIDIFVNLAGEYGFSRNDIGLYLQPVVQNHGCHVEFMVPYDRNTDLDATRKLEQDSTRALIKSGAFFSRPYLSAGTDVFSNNPQNTIFLKKIKDIFDPNRILSRNKWGL